MISTDVFSGMFGLRGQAAANLLSAILGIMFFGFIVWGSYEPMLHAIASGEYEGEGALRVPVWPARLVVLLGSFLVVVSYALYGAVRLQGACHRPRGDATRTARALSPEGSAPCSAIST